MSLPDVLVDLVDEDVQQSGSLIVRIGLELKVDVGDKSRRDGRKPWLARVHQKSLKTHKDQRRVPVLAILLEEFLVVSLRDLWYSL